MTGDMQASIARIDERTQLTHELLKSHIERNDDVHDALHSRISEVARHADDRIDGLASRTNWILGVGTGIWAATASFLTGLWDGLTS